MLVVKIFSLVTFLLFSFCDLNLAAPERLYTQPSFDSKKPGGAYVGTTPTPPPRSSKTSPVPSGPANPFNLTFVVAAKDIPAKKKGAKFDAYIKVFHGKVAAATPAPAPAAKGSSKTKTPDPWTLIGQTETLKDTISPNFLKVFTFEWTKGQNQLLHFEVYDHHTITKDELLGQVDVNVDEYVLQKNQDVNVKLSDAGGFLSVKKVVPVAFRLYARNVPKLDTLNGASDPFVECYWRIGKDGNDTKFYTTKVVKDSENPDWNETIEFMNYQKNTDMWWNFKVFDEDSLSNDVIGEGLVEIDPFVTKRATKVVVLSKDPKNKATLAVTPA